MNNTNEFRQIPGYTNYEVNQSGQIRRIGTSSPLRTSTNNKGYIQIKVDETSLRAHKAVALAWLGVPTNQTDMVNHKDENKSNNHYSNLEWVTNRENVSHSKLNTKKSSKYVGVCWITKKSKWRAAARIDGKLTFFGYHESEEDARDAYINGLADHGISNRYVSKPTRFTQLTQKINTFLSRWN